MTRERDIEAYLVAAVKHVGGVCRKLRWIGRRGAPDRIVFLPGGRVIFFELKAPGKKAEPHQAREHERMRRMGQRVEVVDSFEGIERILA